MIMYEFDYHVKKHSNKKHKQKVPSILRRRNLKTRGFISTVRFTIHTNPSRKRSFLKTPFIPIEKHRLFVLAWTEKKFNDKHVMFLPEFFSNTYPKLPVIVASIKFLRLVWTAPKKWAPSVFPIRVFCAKSS